ncbi:MAG: hypothetical protein DBY32_01600 [Phascolarctobacterium sp.]|nr:MAG: hypothetical protein DBY32_01600 [Phascolarctobacterium sp.]
MVFFIIFSKNMLILIYNIKVTKIFREKKAMDVRNKIVLIDGKDKTPDIKSINFDERRNCINVLFHNSRNVYSYSLTSGRIKIFDKLSSNNIIKYLKEIATHISIDNTGPSYLNRELEGIPEVFDDRILDVYLTRKEIPKRDYGNINLIFPFSFNLSQKKALENAFSNAISVIEGPPGTGKTQTILNIIANAVVNGKTVAVVSNNNEAVKNVIEKLAKKHYDFITAFLGKKSNQQNFFADLPKGNVDNWNYEESSTELFQQLAGKNSKIQSLLEADREKAVLKNELLQWELEQKHFDAYFANQNIEEIDNLPLRNASHKKILSFLVDYKMAKDYSPFNKFIYRLKLIFQYRIFKQKYLKTHRSDLILQLQKLFYQKQVEYLKKQIEILDKKLEKVNFNDLLEEHRALSEKIFEKFLFEKYHDLKQSNFDLKTYKNENNFYDFVKAYPVIVSTTHAIRRSMPSDYLFDYLIIDEASQVDLITGVLALSSCKNVIIVGDAKQLPQITDNSIARKIAAPIPKSEYNYFQESILSSVIKLYGKDLPREILREHYRCHPKIIEFCNKKYYDGQLIAYTSEKMSENPLVICKTAAGNHMRRVTEGRDKGIYSQRELDIIKNILDNPEFNNDDNEIGVITPFRKQANKAAALLNNIEADTVHKYQGRERKEIIFSTVLSSNATENNIKFVDDPHLINVAVSRAVERFILVTDDSAFNKGSTEINDLIRYIEYNTLDDDIINSPVVSVFDLLYGKYNENLQTVADKLNPNADYKSEEIIRVILEEILAEDEFKRYNYKQGVLLRNLINDMALLNDEERRFVQNGASLDFVVFYKQDNQCLLVVEVDGFAFHENNQIQLKRDALKNSILFKYKIPILRLPTNGSNEKEKICNAIKEANQNFR